MLAWPQAQYSCMNMQGELRKMKFPPVEGGKVTDTRNDGNTLCLGFCEISSEVLAWEIGGVTLIGTVRNCTFRLGLSEVKMILP